MSILKEAKRKLEQYCAYRDRCHSEVDNKLYELKIPKKVHGEVKMHLIEHKFLDEERYAKSFARGKFKYNNWGRVKIRLALAKKKVSPHCIKVALREIDEGAYYNTIDELIAKKLKTLSDKNGFLRNRKAATFLIQKGFEPNLVWEKLNTTKND